MAKLFLDTNIFFDVQELRHPFVQELDANTFYISPLTLHIYFYVYKYKIPYKEFNKSLEKFNVVAFTNDIALDSLEGPTTDYEDNIQLHSAVEAECDQFLTRDEQILRLGYFRTVKLRSV